MSMPLTPGDLSKYEGIVNGLRVNELQSLLSHFKSPKLGKKQELIHRCISLLRSAHYQAEVVKLVNDMTRRPSRPAPYQAPSRVPTGMSNGYHGGGGSTMYSAQLTAPRGITALRPVRGLRPVVLPFYDHIMTLLEPLELPCVSSGIKSMQRQAITFSIPRDRAMSLYYRSDVKPLPRFELQLRFFQLAGDWQSKDQPDDFPHLCSVRIDEQAVQLPNVIPTNKPNVEAKRPSRPVNITPYCQPPKEPGRPHRMVVEWSGDKRTWAVAIYIVYRVTANMLKERALTNEVHKQAAEATRQIVMRRLGSGDEDGIQMDQLRVSLLCPLGKVRMGLPARCRTCTHLQCFDLDLYLQMNEKRPTWKCAVCSEAAPYGKLIIDGYFQEMLREVPADQNEVELLKDGGYQLIKEEVFDLSDDDGPTTSASKKSPAASGKGGGDSAATGAQSTAEKPKAAQDDDIIVLDSDSDDDDVSLQKAVAESSRQAAPKSKAIPVPGTQKKDDGIVIIDLDTPPRPTPVARVAPQPTSSATSCSSSGAPPPPLPPFQMNSQQVTSMAQQIQAAQQQYYTHWGGGGGNGAPQQTVGYPAPPPVNGPYIPQNGGGGYMGAPYNMYNNNGNGDNRYASQPQPPEPQHAQMNLASVLQTLTGPAFGANYHPNGGGGGHQ